MTALRRQYLFGLIFIGVSVYQFVIGDYLETALYGCGGLAFIVNALTLEPRLIAHKKRLVIASWILIIATGLLFFYLIQFKFLH